MAMYKVPQDVEGEDKFLGPLTFKQFLFGGGAVILAYLMFLSLSKGLPIIAFLFFPFFIILAVLAFPWGKDQPTEIWLASRLRFIFFPRKRIWDQSGIKNLVTITVPKREEHIYSDGLKKSQVESRLSALATVVDSRGWATKNIAPPKENSDRLVADNRETTNTKNDAIVNDANDILDQKNPIASQFDNMIQESSAKHRKATLDMINDAIKGDSPTPDNNQPKKEAAPNTGSTPIPKLKGEKRQATLNMLDDALQEKQKPANLETPAQSKNKNTKGKSDDYWFLNQPEAPLDPNYTAIRDKTVVKPGQTSSSSKVKNQSTVSADEEAQLLEKVHKQHDMEQASELGRIKTIQPLSDQKEDVPLPTVADETPSKPPIDPDIITLPYNNDLNVETVSRIANKKDDDGEVVIDLH